MNDRPKKTESHPLRRPVCAILLVMNCFVMGCAGALLVPDVYFKEVAPVETVYADDVDSIWNSLTEVLVLDLGEKVQMSVKESGIIRTEKRALNKASGVAMAVGNSMFVYEYDILVKPKSEGTSVKIQVHFWEENFFGAVREKDIPEGANMMRHVLFSRLSEKLNPIYVMKPPTHDSDVRTAELEKVSWQDYRQVYHQGEAPFEQEPKPAEPSPAMAPEKKPDLLVLKVQKVLREKGYDPGPTDGLMGRKTRAALQRFQEDTRIAVTGEPDWNTLVALGVREGEVEYQYAEPGPKASAKAREPSDALRVRSDAQLMAEMDPFSNTLATISKGTLIDGSHREGDWFKVQFSEMTGYIHSSFVVEQEGKILPTPAATAEKSSRPSQPAPDHKGKTQNEIQDSASTAEKPQLSDSDIKESGKEKTETLKGKVTEATPLLAEPSFIATEILNLPAGQTIELLERKDEFYRVRFKEKEGYVYSVFVEIDGPKEP